MISGATGAMAVVYVGMISVLKTNHPDITIDQITQYVFATVILAGLFQVTAGLFKLGKFIRLVPHSVMFGFVNGLAIVIFMAQMTSFQEKDMSGNYQWMEANELLIMIGFVLLTMIIIWGLPKITKAIPSSLAAIIVVSVIIIGFGIDTKTVSDTMDGKSMAGGFPIPGLPDVPFSWETLTIIFPYALIVAGVGLIESLLTLNLIDEITQTRGRGNKECVAQGTANIFSGLFGGIRDLQDSFGCIVGLSDHTLNNITAFTSIPFGASIIEKHQWLL